MKVEVMAPEQVELVLLEEQVIVLVALVTPEEV